MGAPERIDADVAVIRRRRRRALRGADGRRGRGTWRRHQRDAARTDRELLGAGRARRGAGHGRLAATAPRGHRAGGPRAGPPLRRRGADERGARDDPRAAAQGRRVRRRPLRQPGARLEGGHSRRRIVHAGGSATGRRVARQLSAVLVAQPGVRVLETTRAADLWLEDGRVAGVLCEDGPAVRARGTIIAAGGAAALWRRTTNPPGSLGIGLLLAQRAGAAIADLEFVQFHPTAVTGVAGREGFLVTEAIRGEGATLHGPDGERFVEELAPRDEVSRRIWEVMNRSGRRPSSSTCARSTPPFPERRRGAARVRARPVDAADPGRARRALRHGRHRHRPARQRRRPGPLRRRRVRVHGAPGANRLASNSLSESAVFGARAAPAAPRSRATADRRTPPRSRSRSRPARTQDAMWRDAGLVRDRAGLERLLADPHPLARFVARCALLREETRGSHIRRDFPQTNPGLDLHHAVIRNDSPRSTLALAPRRTDSAPSGAAPAPRAEDRGCMAPHAKGVLWRKAPPPEAGWPQAPGDPRTTLNTKFICVCSSLHTSGGYSAPGRRARNRDKDERRRVRPRCIK